MLAEEYLLLKSSYKVKLNKKSNTQVTEYIHNTLTEQKEIMQVVRTIIHQNVQNVVEAFKWSRPIFKTKKDFAYFMVNKNYVTIGFT